MNKYKILFIDEENESFEHFQDFIDNSTRASELDVVTEHPLGSLDEMIERIFEISPDAIITDFRLNEMKTDIKYNVPYDGAELVQKYLDIRQDFPCFVLTSYDDLAINASEDVNKVYVKNILHNKKEDINARATFLDRIIIQIEHYNSRLIKAEEELTQLIERKQKGETNYTDEQRIIELDNFIEKAVDKRGNIPESFKEPSNTEKLGQLLNKVDELINKIESKKDDE